MPRKKEDWFTNINGASQILNRNPRTVGKYVKDGVIDGNLSFGNNTLISMSDIAKMIGSSESTIIKVARAKEIPLWKCRK